jgi:aminoglycoside 3-N-acetyltransferase
VRQFLKHIIPAFLITFYRKRKRQKRQDALEQQGLIFTKQHLKQDFMNAGIKAGDVVMVHSSLSKMGFLEDGANTFIAALNEIINATGTIAMPSFPGMGFNSDYLKSNVLFDVLKTPSRMGAITETFRQLPSVKRSWHPTEPVCALGKEADYLTNAHHLKDTPYHHQSPFFRLCELDAKILLVGVDLNSLTNLHTSEDAIPDFQYPVYLKEKIRTKINHAGGEFDYFTYCHDPAWSKKRKCNELLPHFKSAGFLREVKIGKALTYVIEAKAMHNWMVENYKSKNITMYTPNGEKI